LETLHVKASFGQGIWEAIGQVVFLPSDACLSALVNLAVLSILTALLRRRWLGLTVTGILLAVPVIVPTAVDIPLTALWVTALLAVLIRLGLVASVSFYIVWLTLGFSPPLVFNQWYAGRAVLAVLLTVSVLVWGFYVSLGGQPWFGNALKED